MEKAYVKYSGRGDPNTDSKRQKPLGSLLRKARDDLGWTREELFQATGISVNSIVKYEMAGKKAGEGLFPKSQALAKLCLALKVDPLQAMLACLPKEDYGMYESLSNAEVWKYNHPQYDWVDQQLASVTKDLMLLRSFIQHFIPYLEERDLPEDLQWLLREGKKELDRISDLETRLLQMGVFILPMGSFLMPSGVTDEEGPQDFFDFGKPGVIDSKIAMVVRRTLTSYATRFVQLADQFEHREEEREKHADLFLAFDQLRNEVGPEIDLPSSPSPKTTNHPSEERPDSDD